MAVTFALSNLSHPNPSGIRYNPESRRRNLIAAPAPRSGADDLLGGRPAPHRYVSTIVTGALRLAAALRRRPIAGSRRNSDRAQSNKINHKRRFSDEGLTGH